MTKKRGRPKRLPSLQVKEFERQFREACLPAFLVDAQLNVVYANDYARAAFPEVGPGGLRALLSEDLQKECLRRIANKECFRLALPPIGGISAAIAVTPVAEEEGNQVSGAMILMTYADRPGETSASSDSVIALSNSLRQPLSDIFASLAVMRRKAQVIDQDKQYDPYLQSINQSSYRLLRNINNLVSYQRFCSGHRGRPEVVDFWARLAPILDACSIVLHGSDIPFRFELPDKRYVVHVSCCFAEIEDALMNLISNAFCHSRSGNQVEVTGKNISNGVVVTVSDCGRGIEPDQLDNIFSPFYSRGQGGEPFARMGIGLTVAKQNILMNGGTIAVDSTPGRGTSIAFTLPTCDKPLSPPLVLASGTAQYLQDHFSRIYIGLCEAAVLPPQ